MPHPLIALNRLLRSRRAETALEFAMISGAFMLLIYGILTISLDMFWQGVLDDAVRNAARQVQVDSVTTGAGFVTAVCNELGAAAPNCSSNLQYSVQGGSYFGGITAATLSSSGNLSNTATFSNVTLSTANDPVFLLIQVAYPVPIKLFRLANGVVTMNGTSSLYTVDSIAMKSSCSGC